MALIKAYFWTWTVLPPWLAWGRLSRVSTAHRAKWSTLMLPVCSAVSLSSSPFKAFPAFRDPEVCAGYSHEGGRTNQTWKGHPVLPEMLWESTSWLLLKNTPRSSKAQPCIQPKKKRLNFSPFFLSSVLFIFSFISVSLCEKSKYVCQVRFVHREVKS